MDLIVEVCRALGEDHRPKRDLVFAGGTKSTLYLRCFSRVGFQVLSGFEALILVTHKLIFVHKRPNIE